MSTRSSGHTPRDRIPVQLPCLGRRNRIRIGDCARSRDARAATSRSALVHLDSAPHGAAGSSRPSRDGNPGRRSARRAARAAAAQCSTRGCGSVQPTLLRLVLLGPCEDKVQVIKAEFGGVPSPNRHECTSDVIEKPACQLVTCAINIVDEDRIRRPTDPSGTRLSVRTDQHRFAGPDKCRQCRYGQPEAGPRRRHTREFPPCRDRRHESVRRLPRQPVDGGTGSGERTFQLHYSLTLSRRPRHRLPLLALPHTPSAGRGWPSPIKAGGPWSKLARSVGCWPNPRTNRQLRRRLGQAPGTGRQAWEMRRALPSTCPRAGR